MAGENEITLSVATPTGVAFELQCTWVQAPSVFGEFGVLRDHLPLLAALRAGVMKAETGGKVRIAACGPGFVSAQPDRVEMLTDLFVLAENVDGDEVRKELEKATEKLAKLAGDTTDSDHQQLVREIQWCQARLDALAEHEK